MTGECVCEEDQINIVRGWGGSAEIRGQCKSKEMGVWSPRVGSSVACLTVLSTITLGFLMGRGGMQDTPLLTL